MRVALVPLALIGVYACGSGAYTAYRDDQAFKNMRPWAAQMQAQQTGGAAATDPAREPPGPTSLPAPVEK